MSRRPMVLDSDSESENNTTRNTSGIATPSTAATSVIGTSSKMTQGQDRMEIDGQEDQLDSDEGDDEPVRPPG